MRNPLETLDAIGKRHGTDAAIACLMFAALGLVPVFFAIAQLVLR